MINLGIIKEGKTPPDARVPLSPKQCVEVQKKFKNVKVFVQSSQVRKFADDEYKALGIPVVNDLNHCDILMGVKEVPIDMLLPNKHYFFFSHTIKKQPYNQKLLQAIIKKNIALTDYECLRSTANHRIIGFGKYAGIVGTFHGLRAFGLRNNLYSLKQPFECADRKEFNEELLKVKLPPIKIALTGSGRVAHGIIEILQQLNIREVGIRQYLTEKFIEPVFVQLGVTDYVKRIDGEKSLVQDFFKNPEHYKSDFFRFAKVTDLYLSGHFWGKGSPFIFTRAEAKHPDFKIKVVADISCDIDGPVACTIRPSTIDNPLFGYHPLEEKETEPFNKEAITVMAVDNLPCELPRDASEGFGEELIEKVFPHLFGNDEKKIIEHATITRNGALTNPFLYLSDYLAGK